MPFAEQSGAYWLLISTQGHSFRYTQYNGEAEAQVIRGRGSPFAQEFIETNALKAPPATAMIES